jgi:hypothetical protein
MAEPLKSPAQDSPPLITPRVFSGLGIVALVQAALVAACVWPGWGLFSTEALPASLAAAALGLTLLLAPMWSDDPRARGESLLLQNGRFAFLSLWQAAAMGLFLLISARVTVLSGGAILRAALILGATVWLALSASRRWPRAYLGLALFWAVAIPMAAFIVAEVFISTPNGSLGWSRAKGPGVENFRAAVEWLLRFSPGTAIVGALQGHLPGDATCGWREAGLFAGACALLGSLLQWVGTRRQAAHTDTGARTTVAGA